MPRTPDPNLEPLLAEIAEAHAELRSRGWLTPRRCAILYVIGRHQLPISYYPRASELYALRERAS